MRQFILIRQKVADPLTVMVLALSLAACTSLTPPAERQPNSATIRALNDFYAQWQGTPYTWGGSSSRGIDCSAFVQLAYADLFRATLPRQTRQQAKIGGKIPRADLLPGDLVFFKTGWRNRHVGIYVGNGEFIHASTSEGVTKSSILSEYWNKHFWKATRPLAS